MSILEDLNTLLSGLGFSVETGVFSEEAPDEYVVITPVIDAFELWADNQPMYDVQQARISLFTKGNFQRRRHLIEKTLLAADYNIDERRYIGREDETGYHQYIIDTEKLYEYGKED